MRAHVDAGPAMGERGRLRADGGAAGAWPQAQGREGRRMPRVLRAYFVSYVNSAVEIVVVRWLQPNGTDVHHRGTERTEDSQRTLLFFYPLVTVWNLFF